MAILMFQLRSRGAIVEQSWLNGMEHCHIETCSPVYKLTLQMVQEHYQEIHSISPSSYYLLPSSSQKHPHIITDPPPCFTVGNT